MSSRRTRKRQILAVLAAASLFAAACAEDATTPEGTGPIADPTDSEAPLSDVDALLDGALPNSMLPEEGKADAVYPASFDVVDTQSAVKSQGSRGVCSIFSTTALMEHLYIKEGTIADPDFSEQFLQWSAKFEVGAFKTSGGSNARSNLQAISRYGIPFEEAWTYQPSKWTSRDDERCTGEDDQPTVCYTNGEPPESALQADRFTLPAGRYVNSRARSIKAFMTENDAAVVAGMTFFYQSWNHRASKLPVNSEYWSEGYILYPNEGDKEKSLEKRAGHSILIVGWDDDLEVERLDEEGKVILDDEGNPVIEKGFFLIKNSWGTSGFGIRNEHGAGYGWLSMEYVEEYASIYGAGTPRLDLVEVCDDGIDNDFNGTSDCDDAACSADVLCTGSGIRLDNSTGIDIPDNDPAGASTIIQVDQPGTVSRITVDVDISHSYSGDLTIALIAPSGAREILQEKQGGSQDDVKKTFTVAEFDGESVAGPWTLEVTDGGAGDTGRINSWSAVFELGGAIPPEVCDDGIDNDGSGDADCADAACSADAACTMAQSIDLSSTMSVEIPDGGPDVESPITVDATGNIEALEVDVDITHSYRPDLTVTLVHPSGAEVKLIDQVEEIEQNLVRTFPVSDFDGLSVTGDWTLRVLDNAEFDSGQLNSWTIRATTR